MSENDFWNSTPDKLYRLSKVHAEIMNPSKNNNRETPQARRKGEIITRGETVTLRRV